MPDAPDGNASQRRPPTLSRQLARFTAADRAAIGRRAALLAVTALAGLSYAWASDRDALEPYYEASVRSMATSWHDFLFGSFDPAGTVTLDKLPGAFWIQALSVRAFGLHTWSMILPQAIEGILTVLVLYRATRRLAGPVAGLVAAFVLAISPATVALNRGNVSDSLLVLLLVLAADAVSGAVASGSGRRLLLAGLYVGLAFQAKMIEAWMLLPALGLAYLLDAPGSLRRRLRQLTAAAAVAGLVSLSWMTAVMLVPSAQRPYVDGSHDNSTYAQVFVYNGFGRFGDNTPLQLLAGQSLGIESVLTVPAAEPNRLLRGDLGRDTGWLLPAALAVAAWGLLARRRRPRGDALRSCLVLWGGWLLTLAVVFSVITTINPYYTAALSPAVAALLGTGVAIAWERRPSPALVGGEPESAALVGVEPESPALVGVERESPAVVGVERESPALVGREPESPAPVGTERSSPARLGAVRSSASSAGLIGAALILAGTVAYAAWLVPARGTGVPAWLVPLTIVAGVAALVLLLAAAAWPRPALARLMVASALLAGGLAPAVASIELVAHDDGAFDTPFEPVREASALHQLFVTTPAQVALTIPRLEQVQRGAPWLLATETSALASVFIDESGLEVLPIGGFTGTIPSPTLSQLKNDIAMGRFHLVLAATSSDSRLVWIASHCLNTGLSVGALHNYYCLRPDAR